MECHETISAAWRYRPFSGCYQIVKELEKMTIKGAGDTIEGHLHSSSADRFDSIKKVLAASDDPIDPVLAEEIVHSAISKGCFNDALCSLVLSKSSLQIPKELLRHAFRNDIDPSCIIRLFCRSSIGIVELLTIPMELKANVVLHEKLLSDLLRYKSLNGILIAETLALALEIGADFRYIKHLLLQIDKDVYDQKNIHLVSELLVHHESDNIYKELIRYVCASLCNTSIPLFEIACLDDIIMQIDKTGSPDRLSLISNILKTTSSTCSIWLAEKLILSSLQKNSLSITHFVSQFPQVAITSQLIQHAIKLNVETSILDTLIAKADPDIFTSSWIKEIADSNPNKESLAILLMKTHVHVLSELKETQLPISNIDLVRTAFYTGASRSRIELCIDRLQANELITDGAPLVRIAIERRFRHSLLSKLLGKIKDSSLVNIRSLTELFTLFLDPKYIASILIQRPVDPKADIQDHPYIIITKCLLKKCREDSLKHAIVGQAVLEMAGKHTEITQPLFASARNHITEISSSGRLTSIWKFYEIIELRGENNL